MAVAVSGLLAIGMPVAAQAASASLGPAVGRGSPGPPSPGAGGPLSPAAPGHLRLPWQDGGAHGPAAVRRAPAAASTSTSTPNDELADVSCASSSFCVAVGYEYDFSGAGGGTETGGQPLIETWDGSTWSITANPISSSDALDAVSCVSSSFCVAVGYAGSGQTLTETWNGSTWSVTASPSTHRGTADEDYLDAVSCTSASFCIAVGYYDYEEDTLTESPDQTLTLVWNGTLWSVVTSPSTSSADDDYLSSVSCVSSSLCVASGTYLDASDGDGMILIDSWNGAGWSIAVSQNPASSDDASISAVSCPSATFCIAGGYYYDTSVDEYLPLTESWDGSSWSVSASPEDSVSDLWCGSSTDCVAVSGTVIESWNGSGWSNSATPSPPGTDYNGLDAVSCTSAAFCMAVGEFGYFNLDAGPERNLAVMWNGTSWLITPSPDETAGGDDYLNGVSCSSSSFCAAVGYYYDVSTDSFQPLTESWDGTGWVFAASADTSAADDDVLSGVSCPSASFCSAVGAYYDSGTGADLPLAETWDGSSWSVVAAPEPVGADGYLSGVSCVSASFCTAVGYSVGSAGIDQTLAETWNGTSWSITPSPDTSATDDDYLSGVSCVSASFCTAVGYSVGSTGTYQALAETWDGTSWSVAAVPDPAGADDDYLSGVSCVSGISCTAAGHFLTASGYEQNLIANWNGASWSITASPDTSATDDDYLSGVSCVSASFCNAVGSYLSTTSAGPQQALAEQWNGSSWSVVTPPNPATSAWDSPNGVSCVSASFCAAVGDFYNTGTSTDQTLAENWNGTSWSVVAIPDE
jgi:hypothetical protein